MLQLIGLLLLSWIRLWFFEKQNLSVLGLMPSLPRLKLVGVLLLCTSVCCATGFFMKMYFAKEEYILNESLTIGSVFFRVWEIFRGVVTEELLCRGALLYILIKRIGNTWAIVLSALLFGVLHWLNAGVFGNPVQMALAFAFPFMMGLLLAYGYVKTHSLLIPIAIHWSWNFTEHYLFPETIGANSIFVLAAPPPEVTVSYFVFFLMILFPKVSAIAFDYLILKMLQSNA